MSIPMAGLWTRGKRVALLLRLEPFDTATEEGRAKERTRRAMLTTLAAVAAKIISMASILVTLPLTLHYLGKERNGLWMTISTLVTIVGFADLGLSLGMQNAISHAHGRDDKKAAQGYISSGFFMEICVSILFIVIFCLIYPWLPWGKLYNVVSVRAAAEAGPASAVLVGCCIANIALGAVRATQVGYQEGAQNNLWLCFGSILGVIGLVIAIKQHASLPWLVLALAGSGPVAAFLNGISVFGVRYRWLRPSWKNVHPETVHSLFRLGMGFLAIQLSYAFAYSMDNIIIAHVLGLEAVSRYNFCLKMFNVASTLVLVISASLWPAFAEAYARGDILWMRKVLFSAIRGSILISGSMCLLLVIFGRFIIRHWAGPSVMPSFALLSGLAVWVIIDTIRITTSNFFNAVNIIRFQSVVFVIYGVGSLLAKVYFGHQFKLAGVVWGGVGAYILFLLIPYLYCLRRWLAEHSNQATDANAASKIAVV